MKGRQNRNEGLSSNQTAPPPSEGQPRVLNNQLDKISYWVQLAQSQSLRLGTRRQRSVLGEHAENALGVAQSLKSILDGDVAIRHVGKFGPFPPESQTCILQVRDDDMVLQVFALACLYQIFAQECPMGGSELPFGCDAPYPAGVDLCRYIDRFVSGYDYQRPTIT
jgi:hypothetical protein